MAGLTDQLAALPDVVSVDDLAGLFAVDRQTVWRWLRKGRLPGYRIGRTWRIYRDEIAARLAASDPVELPAGSPTSLPEPPTVRGAMHPDLTRPAATPGTAARA